MISKLASCKISIFQLVSVAEQAGLSLTCLQTPKTGFLALRAILYIGLDATKPVFGVSDKASFKPVSSATETS